MFINCCESNLWADYSDYIVALITVLITSIIRYYFSPKLQVSFDRKTKDVSEETFKEENIVVDVYRITVINKGWQKLINPRVWCVSHSVLNGSTFEEKDFSPFELNWSNTDKDLQVGILLENFVYRIDLFYVVKSWIIKDGHEVVSEDAIYLENNLDVMGRHTEDSGEPNLPTNQTHRLSLIISNDNLLINSYMIELEISPSEDNTCPVIRIIRQSSYGLCEKSKRFAILLEAGKFRK